MASNNPAQAGRNHDEFLGLVLPPTAAHDVLSETESQKITYGYAQIKRGNLNEDQLSLFSFLEVIPSEASILAVVAQIADKLSGNKLLARTISSPLVKTMILKWHLS